jgi:hypothetical protein
MYVKLYCNFITIFYGKNLRSYAPYKLTLMRFAHSFCHNITDKALKLRLRKCNR